MHLLAQIRDGLGEPARRRVVIGGHGFGPAAVWHVFSVESCANLLRCHGREESRVVREAAQYSQVGNGEDVLVGEDTDGAINNAMVQARRVQQPLPQRLVARPLGLRIERFSAPLSVRADHAIRQMLTNVAMM